VERYLATGESLASKLRRSAFRVSSFATFLTIAWSETMEYLRVVVRRLTGCVPWAGLQLPGATRGGRMLLPDVRGNWGALPKTWG